MAFSREKKNLSKEKALKIHTLHKSTIDLAGGQKKKLENLLITIICNNASKTLKCIQFAHIPFGSLCLRFCIFQCNEHSNVSTIHVDLINDAQSHTIQLRMLACCLPLAEYVNLNGPFESSSSYLLCIICEFDTKNIPKQSNFPLST